MNEKNLILKDIENYIRFLEISGYTVSISFAKELPNFFFFSLHKYDLHPHKICNYLKHNKGTEGRCVRNKTAFRQKTVNRPYYSCCYAGVEEYIIPVRCGEQQIACIHVSGFRGRLNRSLRFMKKTEELCDSRFSELYSELSENVPSLDHVLSFTQPLSRMLTEFYKLCAKDKSYSDKSDDLYYKALRIIHENELTPLNCHSLAKHLNYSESYLRQIFKRSGNVSVQTKINEIRLEKAKILLRGTNESVTNIAFSTGFSDSNYFSTYFKKQTGVSPLTYRKDSKYR